MDIHVSPILLWKLIKKIPKLLMNPKENFYISKNIIKGLWHYHIKKNTKYNFVVDKRITNHTVYPNGTLITHSKYKITMIASGQFKTNKNYYTENKELDKVTNNRKVDLNNISKIYNRFDENVPSDRFKDYLIVCQLFHGLKDNHSFMTKITMQDENCIHYDIVYPDLEIFDSFVFCNAITIPNEFNRVDKTDSLTIEPIYGIYEFSSQIDKNSKNVDIFYPELYQDNKEKPIIPDRDDNLFYKKNKWKIFNPKSGSLQIKNKI